MRLTKIESIGMLHPKPKIGKQNLRQRRNNASLRCSGNSNKLQLNVTEQLQMLILHDRENSKKLLLLVREIFRMPRGITSANLLTYKDSTNESYKNLVML